MTHITVPDAIAPIGIQRKRVKGWKMPPNTINVARPGEWGNPYRIMAKGCEAIAVSLFEQDLIGRILLDKWGKPLIDRIGELRGKNLACFCPLEKPCHRDVLLRLSNAPIAKVKGSQ